MSRVKAMVRWWRMVPLRHPVLFTILLVVWFIGISAAFDGWRMAVVLKVVVLGAVVGVMTWWSAREWRRIELRVAAKRAGERRA